MSIIVIDISFIDIRAPSLVFTILEVYNGTSGSWQLRLNQPTFYLQFEWDGYMPPLSKKETRATHSRKLYF